MEKDIINAKSKLNLSKQYSMIMVPKINREMHGILIAAIVLIISVLLLADKLLSTGPVQLILEGGRVVPVEEVSYFTFNDVLFFIITAWLGGMSFFYIISSSRENERTDLKEDLTEKSSEDMIQLMTNLLDGDEKLLFKNILGKDEILQRELVVKTGFSEPKVSRLLDRLEKKGLIFRQRDGMGNRILLKKR